MKSVWLFLLEKKAFTYMMMCSLVIAGGISVLAIPKESSPEVIIPVGIIVTALPGGSSEDVEKLITDKIEEEIINVDNIDKINSSSQEGVSMVSVQFLADADIDKSITSLKEAVDKVKGILPTDAKDPSVTKVNFSDQPILIFSVSSDLAPSELVKLSEDVSSLLKKIPGVSKVSVSGVRKREVQVVVKKEKLAAYGLSLNQIVAAISGSNVNLPVGRISISGVDYPILLEGTLEQAVEISNIAITNSSGVLVYIRDVAEIYDGLESPKSFSRVSVGGAPSENAMTFSVFKKSGGDVTQISDKIKAKIEELKAADLKGSQVVVSLDAGKLVNKDLKELSKTGLETIILVMIVLLLTIGWRESLVAGLSIPLSFVIAFIGLYLSGNTINFLSLFSLILAIGILVDSGIVVAEAIHTRSKKLGDVKEAAKASIMEYAWPLIAGTMTTVAVFAPLFFLSGIVGQFVKSIPFTLIFVLLASIVVALGMVPLLAILLSSKDENEGRFAALQEKYFHVAQNAYKVALGKLLDNSKLQKKFFLSLLFGMILSVSLAVMGFIKVEIFPQDDQEFVIVSLEAKEGTSLFATDLAIRQVEEILYDEKIVESFVSTVGAGSSLVDGGGGANTKLGNITIMLSEERVVTSTQAVVSLQEKLEVVSDVKVTVSQGNNGPPGGKPIVAKILGDDLADLEQAANIVEGLITGLEGTKDVVSSIKDDGSALQITLNKEKIVQAGLSPMMVASILRTAVSGVTAATLKTNGDDVDVVVKVALNADYINPEDTTNTTLLSIKNIPVAVPGGTVLLGSLIETNLTQSRASIKHEDQKRVINVSSDIVLGANAYALTKVLEEKLSNASLPPSVTVSFGGENEDANNTFRDMLIALVAGMVGMLAILVLEFNSVRYAMYLLSAIPLSLIGVLVGLAVTGKALSFSAMLGVIALAGVIINHAIILLDSILHRLENDLLHALLLEKSGVLRSAIIESSAIRLRPIVLTTVTTVVGMIPLAGVSALWGPLAISIMFGLMFAMILTLALIPLLFYKYPGKRFEHLK